MLAPARSVNADKIRPHVQVLRSRDSDLHLRRDLPQAGSVLPRVLRFGMGSPGPQPNGKVHRVLGAIGMKKAYFLILIASLCLIAMTLGFAVGFIYALRVSGTQNETVDLVSMVHQQQENLS